MDTFDNVKLNDDGTWTLHCGEGWVRGPLNDLTDQKVIGTSDLVVLIEERHARQELNEEDYHRMLNQLVAERL